jgi:hypothetical protein
MSSYIILLENWQWYRTDGDASARQLVAGDGMWRHHFLPVRKLNVLQWDVFTQHAYCADLSPCSSYVFGLLKKPLKVICSQAVMCRGAVAHRFWQQPKES